MQNCVFVLSSNILFYNPFNITDKPEPANHKSDNLTRSHYYIPMQR